MTLSDAQHGKPLSLYDAKTTFSLPIKCSDKLVRFGYNRKMSFHCHRCSSSVSVGPNNKVGFRESCDKCLSDLHACLNCTLYDTTAYNSCREPNADRVVDKEKANYCDYFQFRDGEGAKNGGKDAALKKLDDLFK